MVNVPRIHCHSAFKHYEMYHWNCGDSGNSIFNVTYNFNGGGLFGGSFGSGFWNGVGMGLGAGIMNLLGFGGGGGCFGGGFGNMFSGFGGGVGLFGGGFPTFNNWWGGGNSGNITGGTTNHGGNSSITNNTVYRAKNNKDAKHINSLANKVNKFLEKFDNDKYKPEKAAKKARELYDKLDYDVKDDVETDTDLDTLKKSKQKLALKFPELAKLFEAEYNEKPGNATQQRETEPKPKGDNEVLTRAENDDAAGNGGVPAEGDLDKKEEDDVENIALDELEENELKELLKQHPELKERIEAELSSRNANRDVDHDDRVDTEVRPAVTNENNVTIGTQSKSIDDIKDADDLEGLTKAQATSIGQSKATTILSHINIIPGSQIDKCAGTKEVLFLLEVAKIEVKVAYNAHQDAKDPWISGVISNVEQNPENQMLSYRIDCSNGNGTQGNKYTVEQQNQNTFRFSIIDSDDFGTGVHLTDDKVTFVDYEFIENHEYLYRNGKPYTSKIPQ